LNAGYDDCEDRPVTQQQIVACQMNREVWHQVNKIWQQLRSSPAIGSNSIARVVDYWNRVADLLEKQLSRRN
jgi:hypothetical protein